MALGCSDNTELLNTHLDATIVVDNGYSQGERRAILNAVLNSYSGLQAIIKFFEDSEIEILANYGYSLEQLVTIPARSIKTESQRWIFMEYLQTLSHLEPEATARVSKIVDDNFQLQTQSQNARAIEIIRKILGREEPTPAPTSPAPTTPAPTTSVPTTSAPTTPAPTTLAEENTTEGAASAGIKFVTLLTGLFILLTFNYFY